jgi:hypothetical protein
MHDVFPSVAEFSWQRGYAAFTVSQSDVQEVRRYVAGQKEHHEKVSFPRRVHSVFESKSH